MSLLRFRLQGWLLIAVHFLPAVFGVIILTPQNDSIVPYNSDAIITYDCEVGTVLGPFWTIDNLNVQLQRIDQKVEYADRYGIIVEDQMPLFTMSRLNFNVTRFSQSNFSHEHGSELVIGCLPYAKIVPNFPNHTIFVYGPLDAPSNLEFSASSESSFNLSWTGTSVPRGVEVINFIQVTNLSSNVTQEFNTTQDFITFNKTGVCSEFSLTVMSSNEQVGNSPVGSTLQNIPISPDVLPISKSLNTTVELQATTISITLTFSPASVCMSDFPVENYTVRILENNTLPIANFGQDIIHTVINDTVLPALSMDQAIKYSVEACSNVTCRATRTFTAYTTGVQTPTVYFVQKSRFVLVVCDFAIGSRASGCLFNFNFATTSDVVGSEPYNISRDAKINSSLCAGDSNACMCLAIDRFVTSYSTIEAFTLEEDGTYSSISVPAVRRDMSENPERISVCNPPELPTEPVNPAKDKTVAAVVGGVLGGVLGGAIAIIVIVVSVLCIWKHKKSKKQETAPINVLPKNFGSFPMTDGDGSKEDPLESITLKARIIEVNSDNGNFKLEIEYDEEFIKKQCGLTSAKQRRSKHKPLR